MKIFFIRPSDINVTPAFDRILDATTKMNLENGVILHWSASENLKNSNIKCIKYNGKRNIFGYIGWFFFIFKHLNNENPEFIHTFSFLNWFGIFPYRLLNRKNEIFYDCRDYFAWSKKFNLFQKNIIRLLDQFFAAKCKIIIFPDQAGYRYFNTKKKNYIIVPNTVEDIFASENLNQQISTKREKLKLAFLGYTSHDRNIKALLTAVKRYPDLELHIASNFISPNIKEKLEGQRNVLFYGKLDRKECLHLLRKCHYCLITYNPELKNYQAIQPTKFYDSLMANVPYICSKGMFALEAYTGRDWPNVAIEYDNIDAIGNLPFPDSSIKNRELYESKYQYDIIIEQLRNIYKKFLNA